MDRVFLGLWGLKYSECNNGNMGQGGIRMPVCPDDMLASVSPQCVATIVLDVNPHSVKP
jgi:hypothetical protein